jgi:hypothetical protein
LIEPLALISLMTPFDSLVDCNFESAEGNEGIESSGRWFATPGGFEAKGRTHHPSWDDQINCIDGVLAAMFQLQSKIVSEKLSARC